MANNEEQEPTNTPSRLIVEACDNGYVVIKECQGYVTERMAYETNNETELLAFLYAVCEHFKPYEKFNNNNVNISFDKEGHKYEDIH